MNPTITLFDMRPKQISNQGVCAVLFDNLNRLATTLTISGEAKNDNVCFEPQPESITMPASQRGGLCMKIGVRKRPLIGLSRSHLFLIHIRTSEGQREFMEGELRVEPIIPLQGIVKLSLTLFFLILISVTGILLTNPTAQALFETWIGR